MTKTPRVLASALAVFAAGVLLAGCAGSPAGSPTSSSEPDTSQATTAAPQADDDGFEAAWLDEGRMFAIISWGSSTCVPEVEDVAANGQRVAVTLTEGDADAVCTDDLVPRVSLGSVPEGVDPTRDVEFVVTSGDVTDDVDLDGDPSLTGAPGSTTNYTPSAGWFDDEQLVLLTWGSSSCPPVVESVEGNGATGTVTFTTDKDQVCTMDMAPRTTIIAFGDDEVEDDGFELTLVGGNLDATVPVRG